jgi:hypothetical protein
MRVVAILNKGVKLTLFYWASLSAQAARFVEWAVNGVLKAI